MKISSKTAVVVPTYNESDDIGTLVQAILSLPVRLVIVDDNSLDDTGEIADEWARKEPRISVVHRPRKMGLGTAYIVGFKRALSLGTDRVITLDADFSHHPWYIPALLTRSETADLVIGSRYVDGGATLNSPLARRTLSLSANTFIRLALGLKARDCTAGFRCCRRGVLESIALDSIFSDGYSFLIEMLYRSQQVRHEIQEVPIIFEDRRRGASKISRGEVIKALYTVIRLCLPSK